tara:strand:- start:112 stop:309 length:198 start_codon:yes stop_codon:yes gene_type:complete
LLIAAQKKLEKTNESDKGRIKLVKDLLRERFFTTSNLFRAAVRKYPKELPYPKIKISEDAKSDFV